MLVRDLGGQGAALRGADYREGKIPESRRGSTLLRRIIPLGGFQGTTAIT